MSKTSTKKDLNRKHNPPSNQSHVPRHGAAAAAKAAEAKKKRPRFGNAGSRAGKPRKKSQDQKKLSHQQATQARDSLDAEFRDLRAGMTNAQLFVVDGTATTTTALPPPSITMVPGSAGLGLSAQISEQSMQDLAGVLSAL